MTYRFRVALLLIVQMAFVLAAFVLLQACSEPLSVVKEVLRDQNERRAESPAAESQLTVSNDGQVMASGPIEAVSATSLDLAGATFEVSGRTVVSDFAGRSISSKNLTAGTFVEVDGVVGKDGSFEAVFVKEEHTDLVCHIPPGNPDRARTIAVGGRALNAHLEHGDYEGECEVEVVEEESGEGNGGDVESSDPEDDGDESDDPDEEKVAVCHIPPGNPSRARTLYIGISDVQDHLDHGDYEGECLE